MQNFDYVLVGGGLQNGLIAAALAERAPRARVALVERKTELGGNHTWCFHAADVEGASRAFVEPFVAQRWSGYDVRFPELARHLDEPYAAVTSRSFAERVGELAARGALELFTGHGAIDVAPHRVTLASGAALEAEVVIDARGPVALRRSDAVGFQKFLGLELEVDPSSAPRVPTLMDATVPQLDGFRFFYVLPLAPDRVLVEDTYFSEERGLRRVALRAEIGAYAAAIGLSVRRVLREEAGVLPIPSRVLANPGNDPGLLRAGYQGGFFHPTTGYSFPLAVRVADVVSSTTPGALLERLWLLASAEARQQRYATWLNRLMFAAFAPERRFGALEHFYRLPAPTVRRFYALALTPADRLRIFVGRPPRGFSLTRLLAPRRAASQVRSLPGENA